MMSAVKDGPVFCRITRGGCVSAESLSTGSVAACAEAAEPGSPQAGPVRRGMALPSFRATATCVYEVSA